MGWCSATDIFDDMVGLIIEPEKLDKEKVLKRLIETLWREDWDCEFDSRYIEHPMVRKVFTDLRPDFYEDWDI